MYKGPLFDSSSGEVTAKKFRESLLASGADESEILYVHSGLTFGRPAQGLSRTNLLDELVEAILSLEVSTICMPTFTFSFCNGMDFDVQNSRSQMGALNEHFRKRSDTHRSAEPLMSVAAVGEDLDLIENLGIESTGENSTFDKINKRDNVKFLFLGVHPGDCFTYMHYLEWKAKVPYRYNRDFTGTVTDNGASSIVTKELFVRYQGVVPNSASYTYGDLLQESGHLTRIMIGDSSISCVAREPAEDLYLELLEKDSNYFITDPFDFSKVTNDFNAKNMVSL